MKSRHLFMFTVFIVMTGCYEMKQDNKGRTVKINKITGDISAIDGDKIIKLRDETDMKAEKEAAKKLGDSKAWPEMNLPIVGGTTARILTKWADGYIYYQFFANKNLRVKGNMYASITIQLHDNAAFLIQQIPISVSEMTGNIGIDGKTITAMEYKGQLLMSDDTYKKIKEWNVTWSGFDK